MVNHAETSRMNIERMKQIYQQLSRYRGLCKCWQLRHAFELHSIASTVQLLLKLYKKEMVVSRSKVSFPLVYEAGMGKPIHAPFEFYSRDSNLPFVFLGKKQMMLIHGG